MAGVRCMARRANGIITTPPYAAHARNASRRMFDLALDDDISFRQVDAGLGQSGEDAPPELAGHRPLIARAHLAAHVDRHADVSERTYADRRRCLEKAARPGWIGCESSGDLLDQR